MISRECLIPILLSVVVTCSSAIAAESAGTIEGSILERYRFLLLAEEDPEWELAQLYVDQLSADVTRPVISSLEQCRLRGKVLIKNAEGEVIEPERGNHHFAGVQWLLHNEIGYILLGMAGLRVFLGEREGSWHSINGKYTEAEVEESVLQILLEHGDESKFPGWAVVLGDSAEKLDAMVKRPVWKILRNDRDCQSVGFTGGLQMASFFRAGSTGRAGEAIAVDEPCLAMWSEDRLWISDPLMAGGDMEVTSKKRKLSVTLPKEGKVETIVFADGGKGDR